MNNKIQVVIIDDECLARALIREYLSRHSDIEIIGECEHGFDAVQAINTLKPDLIFLDIHMPKLSGLDVLQITGRQSGVIFTTAFDDYALNAFDLHAVDYLLKPYTQERFDAALTQARCLLLAEARPANLAQLIEQHPLDKIVIRDRGQVHLIAIEKIDYIEAQDDYILIHANGTSMLKNQTLSDIETQLDAAQFVRIHRSYVINIDRLNRIERINKDSLVAVMQIMQNEKLLPISRSGSTRIRQLLSEKST